MRNLYLKLFFLLFSVVTFAQNVHIENMISTELSGELNNERKIKIYIPESYKQDSTRVYPLAIVLDAEYLFDIYVANSKLFAIKDKAPEQIVVGIYQNQKNERKTDCEIDVNSMLTQTSSKFYNFIKKELVPSIQAKYRISPFKTIIGNTITANFINYYLVEDEPVFDAYININPSFSLDVGDLYKGKIPNLDKHTYFYLNNGNYNTAKKNDRIDAAYYILKNFENENFIYKYDNFKNSTKVASIGQAVPSALAHIFDMYSSISKEEFNTHVSKLGPGEAIEYLENKYVEIQHLFGSNMRIRQRDIFAVESIILDKEEGDYLEEFGKMINRLYPESPIGDYYIGQYYESGNDLKKALKYYKNGFSKISSEDPNGDGYYQNVERVILKQQTLKSGGGEVMDPSEQDSYEDGTESSEG